MTISGSTSSMSVRAGLDDLVLVGSPAAFPEGFAEYVGLHCAPRGADTPSRRWRLDLVAAVSGDPDEGKLDELEPIPQESGNLLFLDWERRRARCVRRSDDERAWLADVYSVVREITWRSFGRSGCLELHAAAVRMGEGARLFLGDKGVGKSTVSLFFHLWKRAGYVAADKVLVSRDDVGLVCSGVVSSVRLFPESVASLQSQSECRDGLLDVLASAASERAREPSGKVRLSPHAFCSAVSVRPYVSTRLLDLWFIEPDEGMYRLTSLDESAASKRLSRHVRRSIGEVAPSLRDALSRLPCYVLRGRSHLEALKEIGTPC